MKSHKGQISMRPRRKSVGNYVPLIYDAKLVRFGVTLYRVKDGMDGRGEREDWVADLPGVSVSVHDYNWDRSKFWHDTVWHGTFDKALQAAFADAFDYAKSKRREYIVKCKRLDNAIEILKTALWAAKGAGVK